MEAHDDSAPWFLRELGRRFISSSSLFFHVSLSPLLSFSPFSPWWHPRGWRLSAARTETQRQSSWSPSSPSCSGLWVWEAQLWASYLLFYKFCQNARDTEDLDSILFRGLRPPHGYCSSSVYVTYWDAQVKKNLLVPTFFNQCCERKGCVGFHCVVFFGPIWSYFIQTQFMYSYEKSDLSAKSKKRKSCIMYFV